MKKLFAAALLFTAGFSMSALAGLISGPKTFDGGKSVDLQGLEWMPVTYTAGLSRVEVESGFSDVTKLWGTGGWRYATKNETERLLGSLWGGRYDGWSYDNFAGALTFFEMFGATRSSGTEWYGTSFMFGATGECSYNGMGSTCIADVGVNKRAGIYTSLDKINGWQYTRIDSNGQNGMGLFMDMYGVKMGRLDQNDAVDSHFKHTSYASMLVRDVDAPVATVSSPAALSLFALGLCGLLLRRRKIAA